MLEVAVLVSGNGSNLQALIEAAASPGYPARIVGVISNKPGVRALERAAQAGIPSCVIPHRDFADRQAFDAALDAKLNAYGAKLVCMAGFLRLLTPWFVDRWRDRLVNIHPSLLPAFPGLHVQKQALEYGAKFSGCTVHFVRSETDCGPIVVQAAVPILQDDTEETLTARIFISEHKIYPLAVRLIAQGRVNVHNERVFIAGPLEPETAVLNPGVD